MVDWWIVWCRGVQQSPSPQPPTKHHRHPLRCEKALAVLKVLRAVVLLSFQFNSGCISHRLAG